MEKEENEENFWSEWDYIKDIDGNDPDLEERMKYFDEENDSQKEFNCKKCNRLIGKHNLYWHEGMCNECFFNKYFPE